MYKHFKLISLIILCIARLDVHNLCYVRTFLISKKIFSLWLLKKNTCVNVYEIFSIYLVSFFRFPDRASFFFAIHGGEEWKESPECWKEAYWGAQKFDGGSVHINGSHKVARLQGEMAHPQLAHSHCFRCVGHGPFQLHLYIHLRFHFFVKIIILLKHRFKPNSLIKLTYKIKIIPHFMCFNLVISLVDMRCLILE